MDLPSLVTELQIRGFDQDKVDSAIKCLVHVYEVQDSNLETGGILAEDLISVYEPAVVQAASEIFLEKSMSQGREVFRVKWGFEDTAETMDKQLWEHSSERWMEFVSQVDERYLGFVLPQDGEAPRVVTNWKLSNDLKWFSVEIPTYGWRILRMMEDLTEVAWKLDLAFGFRPVGSDGVLGPRVLLHEDAYEALKKKQVPPPAELIKSIRLWKFFSQYDTESTNFEALVEECMIQTSDVIEQTKKFFAMDLTSQYREGQYPPYFINDKKKKEFQIAVRSLLEPVEAWLSHSDAPAQMQSEATESQAPQQEEPSPPTVQKKSNRKSKAKPQVPKVLA
ncbi:MAG TPA: hypothetical protein VGR53_08895 [Nitrososphaerales archaeon]|nr:hypothetical protein [Nitrososphaerales archaeon]